MLEALDRGGVLAIAGIHLSDVPSLDYQRHLFQEREIRSVTANTREDGRALLALATTAVSSFAEYRALRAPRR